MLLIQKFISVFRAETKDSRIKYDEPININLTSKNISIELLPTRCFIS